METVSSYQGTLARWVSEMERFGLGRQRTGRDGSPLPNRGNGQLGHRHHSRLDCENGTFEVLLSLLKVQGRGGKSQRKTKFQKPRQTQNKISHKAHTLFGNRS